MVGPLEGGRGISGGRLPFGRGQGLLNGAREREKGLASVGGGICYMHVSTVLCRVRGRGEEEVLWDDRNHVLSLLSGYSVHCRLMVQRRGLSSMHVWRRTALGRGEWLAK
jgi:hypothetical protein